MKIPLIPFLIIPIAIILLNCNRSQKNTEDNSTEADPGSPETVSQKIIRDLLSRGDFMMYDTKEVKAVHYAEVATAYGAAEIAGFQGDTSTINRMVDRYMKVIDDSIINTANHVDANVYGVLPLELYKHTGNMIFYNQGIAFANDQWNDTTSDGLTSQTRYWIDDVWMIGSLQVQAFRVTKNPLYLNRAAKEINSYLVKLQEPNGLFHHGPDAPFFWGRGNGWVAAGLAELISELPETNQFYDSIIAGYKKMMNALLKYQAEDGMWRQLIDHEEAWEETSSTAMFGYAISVGVKKGLLDKEEFEPVYHKAWYALVKHLNPDGKMTDVCVGTGQSQDVNYYLERPKTTGDFHGQAPVLWFAYRLLQ